ncbi:MerR family transcriptional regulator [Paenibacillus tepidiphilus]|uniref:MerR family transcriptional regulator n=1 Tax=Paenibacillus tepidiphilus TaxID=2608683 RepID=UPI0013A57D88|nr:MerR family transcriptional regulator [Paenibacillus tepidiphilus]
MRIKEVCAACGLTRKAVEYYERQGLIAPEIEANGYRLYRADDVARLKEISLLRKLGVGVSDIREILQSEDRPKRLAAVRAGMELRQRQGEARLQAMDMLIGGYGPDELAVLAANIEAAFTIREKLQLAFPGSYGRVLSAHFGRFLEFRENGQEQRQAYADMIAWLDKMEMSMPMTDELVELLEQSMPAEHEALEEEAVALMGQALQNIGEYLEENKEKIDAYIDFRRSAAYSGSTASRLQELLSEFQQASGYRDIFIPAMKRLSPSYRAYSAELEAANRFFLDKYPNFPCPDGTRQEQ